ncbi:glycoside hydrolase family 5 protein [Botryobasidium botryosum FD-172 SS1]|uniref:glucan 1,3-beta-glucosidase n=1 Tax=Botryobasidium botryosum (strain FD-172 SS1) TaxID=930990 RepID=A0A067M8M2_BOTB1|nr:glycoside hydrolase family 5 protein [Botryobasidium botryosum FD-172 SS1]
MLKVLGLSSLVFAARVLAQLPPGVDKIRGVNLGSWFVVEPYMMQDYWDNQMGAHGACSEWDFVKTVGQDAADKAFQAHWDTMITQDDVNMMKQYGINTVRIPLGFWIIESTKLAGQDYYPNGGLNFLTRGLGWLHSAGIAAILDLHAVPGASTANNAFAGKCTATPGFWANKNSNFQRAANAIQELTRMAHTNPSWAGVFAIEVLNEPPMDATQTPGYAQYLQMATAAIRDTEKSLGASNPLAVTYMDYNWQYGAPHPNPADAASGKGPALYDNHLYYSFGGLINNNAAVDYIANVCNTGPDRVKADAQAKNSPLVFGEWWLAERPGCSDCDAQFHKDFADAQKIAYERDGAGWIFWAWKFRGTDQYRSYKDAVAAGFFSSNAATTFNPNVCTKYLSPGNRNQATMGESPASPQGSRPDSLGWRAPEGAPVPSRMRRASAARYL